MAARVTLGVLRVLALALPGALVSSPLFLVHGFFQFVVGVAVVAVAAHTGAAADRATLVHWGRFLSALVVGIAAGLCGGWAMTPVLAWLATSMKPLVPHILTSLRVGGDPQGALALMPAFQIGLLCALWMAGAPRPAFRALWMALASVVVSQLAVLIAAGSWVGYAGALPHALVLRAVIVSMPIALALLLFVPRGGERIDSPKYHRFWQDVGDTFPDLAGAASTRFYADNERRLIGAHLRPGDRVLKTDLWDEAKNTRILQWTAGQGADVYGIDLSSPIVRQARREFAGTPAGLSQADVRRLPFGDGAFDVVYSMGTVEHFDETQSAVGELSRVLRTGGRLILGVPNRHDPFLRPLLVAALYPLGLYGYGFEKSYSRARLKQMLETAGLVVSEETGILFIPGWLRMLDLLGHTRFRPLTWLTRPAVALFAWIDRRVPWVRRHGYLLASIGVKPAPRDNCFS